MGKKARRRPERLAEKLVRIRTALGLSQSALIKRLGLEEELTQNTLTHYELGNREPSLMTLLEYSRIAGVHTEALIADEIDLPDELPGPVKYEEIKRAYPAHPVKKRRKS